MCVCYRDSLKAQMQTVDAFYDCFRIIARIYTDSFSCFFTSYYSGVLLKSCNGNLLDQHRFGLWALLFPLSNYTGNPDQTTEHLKEKLKALSNARSNQINTSGECPR